MFLHGTITLYGLPFQINLSLEATVESNHLLHHISVLFQARIQFVLCRVQSPLLAASLLISFPAGTKTFQFPAFPLLSEF